MRFHQVDKQPQEPMQTCETQTTRRNFLKTMTIGVGATMTSSIALAGPATKHKFPNVILCMSDDQGWGDTGYNGHPVLKTPNLDAMAQAGLRFDRFYAGAPVCSPTRGSCITGRHPYRYGIFHANEGHMRREEVTLAEVLKTHDYATGHFGKWHLGTLTTTEKDSNRGEPGVAAHYSPPWHNGFDVCFSTEAKVPTYDPMVTPKGWKQGQPGTPFGTCYWTGPGEKVTEGLEGDDSRIIMNRVVPFVRNAADVGKPFLAVVWFHAPHEPVVAGPKHRAPYAHLPEEAQHYFGCITAMDEQVGRLRNELRTLNIAGNTMLWFCSDNGPEGKDDTPVNGTAGPLRGRKRSLFEGGVRVPGLLEWSSRIPAPHTVTMPCSTSDYYPTVLNVLGVEMEGQPRPADGISLLPVIDGIMDSRPRPIAFESRDQMALIDNRFKLISQDKGRTYMLFDLVADPGETTDLAAEKPELTVSMRETLETWRASCRASLKGEDYT